MHLFFYIAKIVQRKGSDLEILDNVIDTKVEFSLKQIEVVPRSSLNFAVKSDYNFASRQLAQICLNLQNLCFPIFKCAFCAHDNIEFKKKGAAVECL